MRGLLGGMAAAIVLLGTAPAMAAEPPMLSAAKPFVLTADHGARKPGVAVDENGVGHFAWNVDNPYPVQDVSQYCRVPRGATACQSLQTFTIPGEGEAFGEPRVLTPEPGVVMIFVYRAGGTEAEGTWAIVSTDGGMTFAAPHKVGSIEPGEVIYGPGTDAVSIVDNIVSAGIHYQAASLDGYTNLAANVGSGQDQGIDGTVGLVEGSTKPIVAFRDLDNAFFRVWSGSGDPNDLGSWGPEQPLGPIEDLRIASGIKGAVLMARDQTGPKTYEHVSTARRFDTTTGRFLAPVDISNRAYETDPIFPAFTMDASGNLAAVFVANGTFNNYTRTDPIRYRASTDGGKTWRPERTLVTETNDGAYNLRIGTGPDGGGFVAWDGNDQGPLTAVAVPPLGASGGGSGSGGLPCSNVVTFGNTQAIATAGCLQKQKNGSYVTHDPVRLNGLDLVPQTARRGVARAAAQGTITVDPVHKKVSMDATNVKAGPVVLDKGSFDWDVGNGTGAITTFAHLEKFNVKIFGFPVSGEATLKFDKNGAYIPAHLELPAIFGGVTGDVTLRLKNPGGLKLDGFKIHVSDAFLGGLEVKPLDVEYKGSSPPVFEGSATFLLPPTYAEPGAHVSFGFVNGEFKHAEGSIGFTPPLALAPPYAYLNAIGLALSTDPLKIAGGVGLSGGPQIGGKSAIKIDALPPANGFSFTFSDPAILRISGAMSVVDIPFAHAFIEFRTNGLFKFGGGLDFDVFGLASITAGVPEGPPLGPGFVDLSDGRFNAPVTGDVCVPAGCGFIDIGAQGVISSRGFGACGQYLISKKPEIGVSAGFGYQWGGSVDVFGSAGGCDITDYAETARRRAAGSYTVNVPAGLPQENIMVTGTGGAPRITVTAPDGETVSSGADGSPAKGVHMAVYSTPQQNATTVLIGKPVPGNYTVTAQAGSPAIARVGNAHGLPAPAVTAKVTGRGHARALRYTVKAITGQTVRFAERSAGAAADLGAAKGTTGTLRFAPAAGPKGTRQIVALVEQNGVPRRELVVASYVAPPDARPGRPRFVRARRAGSRVKVTWGRAANAARYVVRVRLHDGTSHLYVVPGRRHSLTVPGVATRTFGSITVAGLTATSTKPGPARAAGVKKKAKKKRRH